MARIAEFAPAKINLCLHVTGQREDGYHLLETIVMFADIGDRVHVEAAREDRFSLSGPFAPELDAARDNIVVRARDMLRDAFPDIARPVSIHLEKNLPVASGIGGGSADAAASLKALRALWRIPQNADLADLALQLGADVPMCLAGQPLVARGIGERIALLPSVAPLPIVLANPLTGVSTPEIFSRLASKTNPGIPEISSISGFHQLIDFLKDLRNDLELPARTIAPEIDTINRALQDAGAALARMSGSGATCFGLYPSLEDAQSAASELQRRFPRWYVAAGRCIGSQNATGKAMQ
ncbi:4-(cytidine 5'-diphospho)-2-C-methyl-D-erythritol kinase [Hoeflea sp. WL0058]|uniref:4-diphosphocytidyl-2-C-methyl-D-erythritol kinase n=1 Tax=Flavimaribacter sediminis TaxID=2865987 RepID=A0AAE3D2W8_9HYPH|nr:4-(cytidine 5'-diphospho)-2-C-methyl-D-erythritol kinase [Flavimaribacter sediminis]MBW8640224.1 4-(cytidine 5'-diphospho)-2-C-methyl-D-erythritol kinase [Flavimaribacter sediminis]